MKRLGRVVAILVGVLAVAAFVLRLTLGGGRHLEDRTTDPVLPGSVLELVADLPYPPGNIAVAASGRVFFTYHPDGDPPVNVLELIDGRPVAFPLGDAPPLRTVLSLRVDRQNRLWLLDHGGYGRSQPRLLAFDLTSGRLVHQYDFPSAVAGLLSMLNDFQVDPAGNTVYIAETSPIVQRPALIVYDVGTRTSRRLLDGHPTVQAEDFILRVSGRDLVILGLVTVRIGVDSIGLDRQGEWLYFGPVSGDRLARARTADLRDPTLDAATLGSRVEDFAAKTLSDGLSTDREGTVYITDPEHGAILALGADRRLRTLVKDARLRWPDGLSFGPDGWLYVTCSSLQHVLFVPAATMRAHAPYQIYRFRPGSAGEPGH